MSCRGLEKNCTSKSFCTKDHDGTHELWMGNSIIFATIMLLVANLAKSDTVHCNLQARSSSKNREKVKMRKKRKIEWKIVNNQSCNKIVFPWNGEWIISECDETFSPVTKWKSNRSSAAISGLISWFWNVRFCLFSSIFWFFPRFYFFPNKIGQFQKIWHRSIGAKISIDHMEVKIKKLFDYEFFRALHCRSRRTTPLHFDGYCLCLCLLVNLSIQGGI